MNHERCSELLPAYARGDLPAGEAEAIRDHLAACDDCRSEERAVTALYAGAGGEARPLDDVERARLHRALAQELFTARANVDVVGGGSGPPRWARWIVPAVASAAVLAAVVVMSTGGGSDDEAGVQLSANDEGAAQEGGEEALEDASGGGGAGAKPGRAKDARALGAPAGTATNFEVAPEPAPEFESDAGTVDLSEVARSDVFRAFVRSYEPSDGPRRYDSFLHALEQEAGGAGADVAACAATLPQDGSLLPAYGALGELEGRDVLVLGFVTSDPDSDELHRALIWAWERGSCEQPVDTLFEEIGSG